MKYNFSIEIPIVTSKWLHDLSFIARSPILVSSHILKSYKEIQNTLQQHLQNERPYRGDSECRLHPKQKIRHLQCSLRKSVFPLKQPLIL